MRESSCSRSSLPTRRSAPPFTTFSITPSSPVALFQDSYLFQRGTCHPISATSRHLSHRRTSLGCGRHASSIMSRCRLRHEIVSHPRRVRVVRAAASHNRSASSRRRCSLAAPSLRCLALRVSRLWLRQLVALPCAVNPRCFASYRLRRRRQLGLPPRRIMLEVGYKG
jgi:hypothetical protein